MTNLPVLDAIDSQRTAELKRLQLIAASGFKGAVAARTQMQRLRNEQLREAIR